MGKFRYYLYPVKEQTNFSWPYNSATMDAPFYTEIEITDFILEDSLQQINTALSDSKHKGGLLTYPNFKLEVNNQSGLFKTGSAFFPYKQKGSKFKVEWDEGPDYPICGAAKTICGDFYLVRSRPIFEGIIFDDPLEKDSDLAILQYQVLGYLSLLKEYGNFTFDTIAHQNTHAVIFQLFLPLLERGIITQEENLPLLSPDLMDYINFARDHNQPDVIFVLPPDPEKKNLRDLLNEMMEICGGYIFFVGNQYFFRKVVYDSARPDYQFECYNQNSNEGIENISDISLKPEFDRVFSTIVWTNNEPFTTPPFHSIPAADPNLFGIKEFKVDKFEYVKGSGDADKVLAQLAAEFSTLKTGISITMALTFEVFEPNFLESVKVVIPKAGPGLAGSSDILSGIVLGKKIDMKKETMTFYLRTP